MKIKYLILPVLFLSQSANAINSKYKCDQVIFSGLDITHQKSVKVCLSGDKISYTFGSINSPKNELDMLIKPNNAGWDYYENSNNRSKLIKTIILNTGPYTYRMTTGKDASGLVKSFIVVYKGGNVVLAIPLDNRTVINQVSPLLRGYGVPFIRDKNYEYKKRNPADTFYFS